MYRGRWFTKKQLWHSALILLSGSSSAVISILDGRLRYVRAKKKARSTEEISAQCAQNPFVDYRWLSTCAPAEPPNSIAPRFHHVVLYKLSPVAPARIEEMMMNARMQLLKIPEVQTINAGNGIDPEYARAVLYRDRFESMEQFAMFRGGPIFREI